MTNYNAGSFTLLVLEGFLMKGMARSGLLKLYVNQPFYFWKVEFKNFIWIILL